MRKSKNIIPPIDFKDLIVKNNHIPVELLNMLGEKYELFDINKQVAGKQSILYIPNSTAFNTLKQKTGNEIHAMLIYDYSAISKQINNQIYINPRLEYYALKYEGGKMKLVFKTRKKSDKSNRAIKHFLIYNKDDNSGALLTRKQ